MDYKQMTPPCGIDCFNCPIYLSNDNEFLKAELAKRLNMQPKDVVCKGCRNHKGILPLINMAEPCKVYECTEKKGIEFCFECTDFPCDNLNPIADNASQAPHNIKVYNLCLIKKMGLVTWAETKAKSVRDTYFTKKFPRPLSKPKNK